MLEHLFSSKVRIKLLGQFLLNPDKACYVRELTRKLKERINSIRRELDNLSRLGLLEAKTENRKKYYKVNRKFELYEELRSLMLKAGVTPQDKITRQFQCLKGIKLGVLTGMFTQQKIAKTDLLVVGRPNKFKLQKIVEGLEREMGKPVRFAIIDEDEYKYRMNMRDRFLADILSNEHVRVVDKMPVVKAKKQ